MGWMNQLKRMYSAELDLKAEGLDQMLHAAARNPESGASEQDLQAVKDLLIQHAGPLQAAFLFYE